MVRVLRPGGRLALVVWEALDRSEAYPIEVELLERMAGTAAAAALRAPFVLGDSMATTRTLQATERTLAEAEVALARYLRDSGEIVFDVPAHIVVGHR